MTDPVKAVFLSYASQDAEAAGRICEALRAAGIEVWFDQSELRGGDAWDQKIRREIRECELFIPIISATTQRRTEGYFRLEWRLADQRTHLMGKSRAFLVPVCIDDTRDADADVPDSFAAVQWTRLPGGDASPAFKARITTLLITPAPAPVSGSTTGPVSGVGDARAAEARRISRTRLAIIAFGTLVVVGFAYIAFERLQLREQPPADRPVGVVSRGPAMPVIPEKSIAVLPFVDMSEKKDQEYFSDGLSEELIDQLAQSADLKVIARTSSFQFKGKTEDVRTIGQRLGVANLLEGSVRTSGKTMRVTAQLIKASDGSHLWSETFDRDRGDIFKVQDSIAAAVVASLQTKLSTAASSPEERPSNQEAYAALLRGRYIDETGTAQDMSRAIAAFEEAIRLEPRYATAWVALAKAYNELGIGGDMPPGEAYTAARKAVDQALAIDPNLATAHNMLGALEWNYNRDFEASEKEFGHARDLGLGPAKVLANEGFNALAHAQLDKAILAFQKLVEINPLDGWSQWMLQFALFSADRLPEAEATLRHMLDINPKSGGIPSDLGDVLIAEHKPGAALAIMREEPDERERWRAADALWALGRRSESDALLTEAISKYADSKAYWLARSYALRDDKDEAFNWLYRGSNNREPFATLMKADPLLRNLRGDPRFKALLRKLKLPE